MKVESWECVPIDEVDRDRTVYVNGQDDGCIKKIQSYPHHEDKEGACTIREYMEEIGTENAYDSGRVGRSMRTASAGLVQKGRS